MKRVILLLLIFISPFTYSYSEEYINVDGKILEFDDYEMSLKGLSLYIKDYFLKLSNYKSVDFLTKENYKLATDNNILIKGKDYCLEDIESLRENYHTIINRLDIIKKYFLQEEKKIYKLISNDLKEDIKSYDDLIKYKDIIINEFNTFDIKNKKRVPIENGEYYSESGKLEGRVLYKFDSGLYRLCFYKNEVLIGDQFIKTSDMIKRNAKYQLIKESGLSMVFRLDQNNKYLILNYMDRNLPSIRYHFDAEMNYKSRVYYNDELYSIEYAVHEFLETFSKRGSASPFVPVAIYYNSGEKYIAPIGNKGIGYKNFADDVECIANFDEYYLNKDTDIIYFDKDGFVEFTMDDEIKNIAKKTNDLNKIRSIYKYIAKKIKYYNLNDENKKILSHTAYSAFKYHTAVCDGYAEYFKYILDYMNIENKIVYGEVDEEGKFKNIINHAWNMIKIDDEYRHFDITWDDNDYLNRVDYDYFNKTDEDIKKTHRPVYNNDK